MKVRARVSNPGLVEMTLQVTMTLAEWGKVRDRLIHPQAQTAEWELRDAITRAIKRVEAVVDEDADVSAPEVKV